MLVIPVIHFFVFWLYVNVRLLNLARTLLNSSIHYFSSYISIKTDFLQTPLNLGSRPFLLLPLWE